MTSISITKHKSVIISNYISEVKTELLEFIKTQKRVLLKSNPASGKTSFFTEIAKEHQDKKRIGKFVFVAPFRIILDQFKEQLAKDGYVVNLELHADSERLKNGKIIDLCKDDKIILSTYKSLRNLEYYLTKNDIIVVDEAHALFFNYKKSKNYEFSTRTIQTLFHSKSKIVLMSGTPHEALNTLLKLKTFEVIKKDKKATINIQYSKESHHMIALEFAKACLKEFDKDCLNIIYIKNTRTCNKISDFIEQQLNCTTQILTADLKDSNTYKELVLNSTIKEDIQFLICTNVISTGANILNKKIGKALMLDEFNPVEIVQFSKRFRNKLDIEIDIVNRNPYNDEVDYKSLITKRNEHRKYLNQSLYWMQTFYNVYTYNTDFSEQYIDPKTGTPWQLTNSLIERYTASESYYIDKISSTHINSELLVKALKEYDNVNPIITNNYSIHKTEDNYDNEFNEQLKNNLELLFNHVFANINKYLSAVKMYSNKHYDFYLKTQIKNLNIDSIKYERPTEKILKTIKTPEFKNKVLIPFLKYFNYIGDIDTTLQIIQKNNSNQIRRKVIALDINDSFKKYFEHCLDYEDITHEYFDFDKEESFFETESLQTLITIKSIVTAVEKLNKQHQFLIKIIKLTFDYLLDKDRLFVSDLKQYLKDNIDLKPNKSIIRDTNSLYEDIYDTKKEELRTFFIHGLVSGIFYTNTKPTKIKINEIDYNTFAFNVDDFSNPLVKKCTQVDSSQALNRYNKNSKIDLNRPPKIIPSKELLIQNILK